MLSTRLSIPVLAAAMLASPALAEDPIVSRVVVWKPKPGMEAKLEAGIKAHNEFHRKQNDANAFETFAITSGPDSGAFVRVAAARNWKDFDAEALGDKADQADSAVNTEPYIASAQTGYWRVRLDLSHPRAAMTPPAMWAITFYRVKFDKTGDFERARKKIKEATDKANWPRNFLILSLVSGGEGPTFAILQARDKFADFNPPEGKTFAQMMEEQVGRDEAELVDRTIGGAVESTSTEIVNYRADLSYMPAKK